MTGAIVRMSTRTESDQLGEETVIRSGRPSAEDAEALTDRILQASWALLLDIGFEKFSFDKLARFGRLGKPTIYARFSNKAELLRAVLLQSIEQQTQGLFDAVADQSIDEAIPALSANVVEYFHSPEGRLTDRLIDWIDVEAGDGGPSMRGWAAEEATLKIRQRLENSIERGEIRISDIDTVSLFLVEGIAGHARLTKVEDQFDRHQHLQWAHDYWAMIKKAFGPWLPKMSLEAGRQ